MAELSITQRKLRMLCERVPRVLGRHRDKDAVIATFDATLMPKVSAFMETYDLIFTSEVERKEALSAGHAAVDALRVRMQMWRPVIELRIRSDAWKPWRGSAACPDQVIGDAQRLIAVVDRHRDLLPCAQQCLANMREVLANAQELWKAAQNAQAEHQELQRRTRKLGAEVNAELILLRKVLRAALGQSHEDYQTLRYKRSKQDCAEIEDTVDVSIDRDDPAHLVESLDSQLGDSDPTEANESQHTQQKAKVLSLEVARQSSMRESTREDATASSERLLNTIDRVECGMQGTYALHLVQTAAAKVSNKGSLCSLPMQAPVASTINPR